MKMLLADENVVNEIRERGYLRTAHAANQLASLHIIAIQRARTLYPSRVNIWLTIS